MALLDMQRRVAHRARGVFEQHLLLRRRHQPEQVAGLLIVIVLGIVVEVVTSLPPGR